MSGWQVMAIAGLVVLLVVIKTLLGPREVEGPVTLNCAYCEARFLSARGLQYHMHAAHPETWEDR